VVCDHEASIKSRFWHIRGCCTVGEKKIPLEKLTVAHSVTHYSVTKTKPYCSMTVHPADMNGSISFLHTFWTRRTVLTVFLSTHNRLTMPYVHHLHESPLVYPSAVAKRDTHHCTFRKPFALRTSVLWATCKAC